MKRIEAGTRWQTFGLFGPSGGGKTSVAATAPKPIILDSNQGALVLANRPGLEHVRSEDIHKWTDLERAYRRCRGIIKKGTDWSKMFQTITFDHFDDIQQIVLSELGEAAEARDDRRDPDVTEQREWGIMGSRLRRYIRKFKAIPMHKILIFGEQEDHDEGRLKPSLVGALRAQIPYFVDHMMYLRIAKDGTRYLHLDPGKTFYAKTRAWWLTPEQRKIKVEFDNPTTLTDLFALIAAGPKGTTKRRTREK